MIYWVQRVNLSFPQGRGGLGVGAELQIHFFSPTWDPDLWWHLLPPILSLPGALSVRSALLISPVGRFGPRPFPGCRVMLSRQLLQLSRLDRTLSNVVAFSALCRPCGFTYHDALTIVCEGFGRKQRGITVFHLLCLTIRPSCIFFFKEKDRS